MEKTERQKLLDLASQYVHKDRSSIYGKPERNFEDIAKIYEVIFGHPVTCEQVALTMLAVKISRLARSPKHYDSWVDVAGYAACGGEIAVETPEQNLEDSDVGFDTNVLKIRLKEMDDSLVKKWDKFEESIAQFNTACNQQKDTHSNRKENEDAVNALLGIFGFKKLEE